MICFLGSANRDDRRFAGPDKFDMRRTDLDAERAFTSAANHLAFGGGRHFCLGAIMAKTEVEIAVNRLLDAAVGLRFAGGEPPADEGLFLRGPRSCPWSSPRLSPDRRTPMLLRCKTKVNAAAETVFACVDEPEHIVKWVGGAVDHVYSQSETRRIRWARRFLQKLRMGNSVREFDGEIIAWEKPTHFGLHIPTAAYSSEAHFRITPEGSGTLDRRLFDRRHPAHAHCARDRRSSCEFHSASSSKIRSASSRPTRRAAGSPGQEADMLRGRSRISPARSNCGSCASATAGLIRSPAR